MWQLVTLNKQALASKPPVSIRVFDHDEAGHDLLGSTEVPLHKITSAEHAKLDDEIVDGKVYKGRVLKLENHPIQMPGLKLQSTINALLYFAPDLPAEVMLEEQAERRAQALSDEYMARLKTFYASLPGRIRTQLEQAMLIEFGRGPYARHGGPRRPPYTATPWSHVRPLKPRPLTCVVAGMAARTGTTNSAGSSRSVSSLLRTRTRSSTSFQSTSRRSSRPPKCASRCRSLGWCVASRGRRTRRSSRRRRGAMCGSRPRSFLKCARHANSVRPRRAARSHAFRPC
jgi:hypothetical protein